MVYWIRELSKTGENNMYTNDNRKRIKLRLQIIFVFLVLIMAAGVAASIIAPNDPFKTDLLNISRHQKISFLGQIP